jgi:hypothetical protein
LLTLVVAPMFQFVFSDLYKQNSIPRICGWYDNVIKENPGVLPLYCKNARGNFQKKADFRSLNGSLLGESSCHGVTYDTEYFISGPKDAPEPKGGDFQRIAAPSRGSHSDAMPVVKKKPAPLNSLNQGLKINSTNQIISNFDEKVETQKNVCKTPKSQQVINYNFADLEKDSKMASDQGKLEAMGVCSNKDTHVIFPIETNLVHPSRLNIDSRGYPAITTAVDHRALATKRDHGATGNF